MIIRVICLIYYGTLIGALPFEGDSNTQVLDAVKNKNLCFEGEVGGSISARDLKEKRFTRHALERSSAEEVLRHPWIVLHTEDRTLSESKNKASCRMYLSQMNVVVHTWY